MKEKDYEVIKSELIEVKDKFGDARKPKSLTWMMK